MISSYAELKTALTAWSKRTDLADKYADFIALAETTILRALKLRVNEASVSGTATGTIAFPAALGNIVRLDITTDGALYKLDYASPGIESTAPGQPYGFTVQEDSIRIIPTPGGAYTYTLHYLPNLMPLSDANPTNWALTNSPDVYLYGAMCQLARYTLDDESFARYMPMFQGALDAVKRSDEGRRFPLSSGLQIKPRNAR